MSAANKTEDRVVSITHQRRGVKLSAIQQAFATKNVEVSEEDLAKILEKLAGEARISLLKYPVTDTDGDVSTEYFAMPAGILSSEIEFENGVDEDDEEDGDDTGEGEGGESAGSGAGPADEEESDEDDEEDDKDTSLTLVAEQIDQYFILAEDVAGNAVVRHAGNPVAAAQIMKDMSTLNPASMSPPQVYAGIALQVEFQLVVDVKNTLNVLDMTRSAPTQALPATELPAAEVVVAQPVVDLATAGT